jgi:hypothetical protein
MIAICQPTATQWSPGTVPPEWNGPPERTGSLRRIDEIVNELLARYPHAVETSMPESRGAGLLPVSIAANASSAEMMLVAER